MIFRAAKKGLLALSDRIGGFQQVRSIGDFYLKAQFQGQRLITRTTELPSPWMAQKRLTITARKPTPSLAWCTVLPVLT